MPRPNPARRVTHESMLARRLQYEREKRNLTYESLAQRMTQAGCSMQASAIYKIEKGEPPRRIAVNELMVFAQVFDLDVKEILVSPDLAARQEVRSLIDEWRTLLSNRARVIQDIDRRDAEIRKELQELLEAGGDGATSALRAELNAWLGAAPGGWGDRFFDLVEES